jgi:hypothetical protein
MVRCRLPRPATVAKSRIWPVPLTNDFPMKMAESGGRLLRYRLGSGPGPTSPISSPQSRDVRRAMSDRNSENLRGDVGNPHSTSATSAFPPSPNHPQALDIVINPKWTLHLRLTSHLHLHGQTTFIAAPIHPPAHSRHCCSRPTTPPTTATSHHAQSPHLANAHNPQNPP